MSNNTNVVPVDDVVSAYYAQGQGGGGAQDDQGNPVTVSADQVLTSGTEIGGITIGSNRTAFYAPSGSNVSVNNRQTEGVPIADITVDGQTKTLYAPVGEGGDVTIEGDTVTVTPLINTGTAIATITVNNNPSTLYAPANSGGGSSSGGSSILPLISTQTYNEAFSNAIFNNLSINDSFYIEGILYKTTSSPATKVSLWGSDGSNGEKVLVSSLSVSTSANTYFSIYGKKVTEDGKWVCWARTATSPTASPSSSGTAVGGSSWHAFTGWNNDIGNIISYLRLGTSEGSYGYNTQISVYGA